MDAEHALSKPQTCGHHITESQPMKADGLSVLSLGGGVNSTALLFGLVERGTPPDLILFADTGAEHDRTYAHLKHVDEWLQAKGMQPVVRVNNAAREGFPHKSLEDECLNNKTLPSLAFGFKGCSVKWKRQPMDRFVKSWPPAKDQWAQGNRVTRLIGIDAGERHRGKIPDDKLFTYEFPLIEWGWGRAECIEAIESQGMPVPGKSACWFCPATTKPEILKLAHNRPDLFDRAVKMERNAASELNQVKGLARHSLESIVEADSRQIKMPFFVIPSEPCLCFDGSDSE